MTIGDFLNTLAKSAGIPLTDAALVSFLSKAEIATATIDDTIVGKIQSNLLTIESAKQNPELKKYYHAQALNALDSHLNTLSEELQLSDEVKAELLSEQSSYKRAGMMVKKVKELEAQKANAKAGDKDKLAEQINTLNAKIAEVQQAAIQERTQLLDQHRNDRINWELSSIYNGYTYAGPASKEANTKLADILIKDALLQNSLKIENQEGQIKLLTKEGTEYYQNNQKVNVKDFIDKTLVAHKAIVIQQEQTQQQQQNQTQQTVVKGKNAAFVQSIDTLINEGQK